MLLEILLCLHENATASQSSCQHGDQNSTGSGKTSDFHEENVRNIPGQKNNTPCPPDLPRRQKGNLSYSTENSEEPQFSREFLLAKEARRDYIPFQRGARVRRSISQG
jgi:hypothetical protein